MRYPVENGILGSVFFKKKNYFVGYCVIYFKYADHGKTISAICSQSATKLTFILFFYIGSQLFEPTICLKSDILF